MVCWLLLLTDVADQLHEDSKKINSVERLSRHLNKGVPKEALRSYLHIVRKWVADEPVVHLDDSDVVNRMATNSKLWALFGMDPKALVRKMSMKKAIM
ncbi:MAG: hypothetical protein ACOX4J_09675 [Anaerovoracaceae bacterium]